MIKQIAKYGIGAALTGMFCCVAPAVLFGLGLAGGVYAISFANFFYTESGDPSAGAWVLRGLGAIILAFGIYRYNKKENCSLNTPKQRRLNKWLFAILVTLLGVGLFYSFEAASGWYFDKYIVPAQQEEYEFDRLKEAIDYVPMLDEGDAIMNETGTVTNTWDSKACAEDPDCI